MARSIPTDWQARYPLSVAVLLAACYLPASAGELFRDDFSRFPPGWLTRPIGQLNGAIQEYHYLPHRGVPLGPWANAICHLDAWAVGDEEGTAYLEQHTVNDQARLMNPIFMTGDPEWGDYTRRGQRAAALARRHGRGRLPLPHQSPLLPLRADRRDDGPPGGAPAAREGSSAWRSGASSARAAFPYDTTRYYRLRVENEGSSDPGVHRWQAHPDGRRRRARPGEGGRHRQHPGAVPGFPRHRARRGEGADRAIGSPGARRSWPGSAPRTRGPSSGRRSRRPKFGAGRNVRFGDLDGDGVPEMLIAQNIPRIGDNFIQISCLTAVTFDGKVLWQLGRPDPRNGLLTADTPVPDPRHRRRRPQRGRDGQGLQAPGPGGPHGPAAAIGLDAAGSARQSARSRSR